MLRKNAGRSIPDCAADKKHAPKARVLCIDIALDKLHIVADYEGRSANSQILILIRDCIEDYEQKHGKISLGGRE